MNIALLSWEFPPKVVGGLGTYTYELARHLVKMEHTVAVFTVNDGALKTRELIGGIEVHRPLLTDISHIFPDVVTEEVRRWGPGVNFFADVFLYNLLVSTKILNDLIPKEQRSFDILSVHDWLSSMGGLIIKRAVGLPMAFHVHSTEVGRTLGDGSKIVMDLEKKTAQAAEKIITVSYSMKDELLSLGYQAEKVEVVWNGVDPHKYSPDNVPEERLQAIKEMYGIEQHERVILYLGRLTGVKGVDKLLMALPYVLEKFPRTKLLVVGKGEMEEHLVRLSRDLGIQKNVIFNFSMLPEEERIAYYAAADLAAFPSLYEPFGIVALEAMAMKKPVVVGARGVSGLREVVVASGPGQCGYHVNPYDPKDIAWGINSILSDEAHMRRLGENARARVLAEFTWEKVAKQVVNIYASIIEQKSKN